MDSCFSPGVLAESETQTALYRISTQVANSISYDNNNYVNHNWTPSNRRLKLRLRYNNKENLSNDLLVISNCREMLYQAYGRKERTKQNCKSNDKKTSEEFNNCIKNKRNKMFK